MNKPDSMRATNDDEEDEYQDEGEFEAFTALRESTERLVSRLAALEDELQHLRSMGI